MTPLGRGFYEFNFSSVEDLRSVWPIGSWNLSPGFLRLFQWSQDFNPNNQKHTHVQCWIRIYELPQKYWRPKILFEIANRVGTPISIDEPTRNKVFGHYARVLVDIDLTKDLIHHIMVERVDFAFYVGIDYENIPEFCSFYHAIGHSVVNCKKQKSNPQLAAMKAPDHAQKTKAVFVPKQVKQTDILGKGKDDDTNKDVIHTVSSSSTDDNVIRTHDAIPEGDPQSNM